LTSFSIVASSMSTGIFRQILLRSMIPVFGQSASRSASRYWSYSPRR